jgi:hypothetical protein
MRLAPELAAQCLMLAGLTPEAAGTPRKYHNTPTVGPNGRRYDSAKEARHATLLHALQRDGLIRDLREQVTYRLEVNGVLVCRYRADFVYVDAVDGRTRVTDVKGVRTPEYKLKAKLMKAIHGITIEEV